MPLALPIAILGSAAIGAAVTSSAAGKAADASTHAADQSAQITKDIYTQQRADQRPYVEAGYGAVNALTNRLGLPSQGGSAPSAPIGYPAYGDNGMPPPPNSRTGVIGAQGMGGYDAGNALRPGAVIGGDDSGYAPTGAGANLTRTGPGTFPPTGVQTSGAGDPYYLPDGTLSTAPPPGAPNQPTNALTGTDSPGTYANGYTDRTYTPPPAYETPAFDFSVDSFTNNPAFKFAMDQGTGQVLASASATGARQSGAALKALQDRGQQTAYQFYAPERDAAYGRYTDQRNFGYGKAIDERNFGRASFDTDRAFDYGAGLDNRNYLTGRFDQGTNDLFRLTGVGAGAASANGQAGANYATNMTGILNNNAANQGNAAIAGANSMTSLLGSGVNALAYSNGAGTRGSAALPNALRSAAAANPYLF